MLQAAISRARAWEVLEELVLDSCASLKLLQMRLPSLRHISLHGCSALQAVSLSLFWLLLACCHPKYQLHVWLQLQKLLQM